MKKTNKEKRNKQAVKSTNKQTIQNTNISKVTAGIRNLNKVTKNSDRQVQRASHKIKTDA